jgi:gliding motility-associated-like protein
MRKHVLFLLLLTVIILPSYGQLIGSQIFLQGSFSEVGISPCGVYGAQTPPPGYNGNVAGALGFVADHEMDGWSTSSPGQPVRCGDYFYPGAPYEGWGIEINGVGYGNYNSFGTCDGSLGGGITGSPTFYTNAGNSSDGQWEGDIITGSTNLHICQYTMVPDSELYFSTTITLTNNGSSALNNVYYMRHLDPDNEQPSSGSFNTNNTVVQNPSGANTNALCTATGQMYGCFLGMLSTGYPDARAFIGGGVSVFPSPIADTWNGNGIAGYDTTVGSVNGGADDCMGISHFWTSIAPGQSVTFKFYYVLDPSAISNAINASQDIDVYVNGVLASGQGLGGSGTGSCSSTTITDTILLRGLFCKEDLINVDINATAPYLWTWPISPEITLLDALGDSAAITSTNVVDSVSYAVSGVYNVGSDTSHVVIIFTFVQEKPVANFSVDVGCLTIPTCFYDSSFNSMGSNIVSWQWNFDEGGLVSFAQDTCVLLQNPVVHNVELIVTTANGCRDTFSTAVTPNDVPAQFTLDDMWICSGEQIVLSNNLNPGDDYLWSTGDTTTSIIVSSPGTYILTVSNYCGPVKDTCEVVVLPQLNNIVLPNVLTPNGDALNDEYIVSALSMTDDYQMDFFDRWGILLFSTKDMNGNPWKGKTGTGSLVPEGTYFIVLRAINCDGTEVNKTQFISVFH